MSGRVTENVCVNMEVFCWCQHGGIQLTESRTYAQPLLPAAGSRAMRESLCVFVLGQINSKTVTPILAKL